MGCLKIQKSEQMKTRFSVKFARVNHCHVEAQNGGGSCGGVGWHS